MNSFVTNNDDINFATSPTNIENDNKLTTFWGRPIAKSYVKVFEIEELRRLYLSGIIF